MMKTKFSNCFALLLTAIFSCFIPLAIPAHAKGAIEKRSYFFKEAGIDMEYSLFIPRSYKNQETNPLLVVLHGLGSNPSQVIRYAGITQEAEKRGYVVVAPYGYNSRGWYGSMGKGKGFTSLFGGGQDDPENLGELSEKDVMNVLKIVRDEYRIDEKRIFLMGHSMGGGGTLHLGSKYSDIWAGLAPLAPAFMGNQTTTLSRIKHIPVIVVTGDQDRLIPVDGVRSWVTKMKEMKMDVVYNEIKAGNHVSTITRNPQMIAGVFDFFEGKRLKLTETVTATPAPENESMFRVLTNKSGYKIRAKVVAVSGDKIAITREDGRKYTLPISMLSEADQKYIKTWSAENGQGKG